MNVPVGQTQPGLQFDEHCKLGLWFLFVHDSGQVGAHSVNVLSFGHVLAVIRTNKNFDLTINKQNCLLMKHLKLTASVSGSPWNN